MRAIVAPFLTLALAAVVLTACGPAEAPGGADAPPPADAPIPAETPAVSEPPTVAAAPAEFQADYSARGTEPFWRIDIKGGGMKLTQVGMADVTATNAGLAALDGRAVWTAQSGETAVIVTLVRGDCSDGMSDLKYPYTAEVKVGDATLKGCGFRTDAAPREGQ